MYSVVQRVQRVQQSLFSSVLYTVLCVPPCMQCSCTLCTPCTTLYSVLYCSLSSSVSPQCSCTLCTSLYFLYLCRPPCSPNVPVLSVLHILSVLYCSLSSSVSSVLSVPLPSSVFPQCSCSLCTSTILYVPRTV